MNKTVRKLQDQDHRSLQKEDFVRLLLCVEIGRLAVDCFNTPMRLLSLYKVSMLQKRETTIILPDSI